MAMQEGDRYGCGMTWIYDIHDMHTADNCTAVHARPSSTYIICITYITISCIDTTKWFVGIVDTGILGTTFHHSVKFCKGQAT